MQKLPGVSHQTGGRRIPIRVRMGLRSGNVVQRSPYRGRIGDGPDPGKWGSGRGFPKRIYGVKIERLRTGFPKSRPEKISRIFFKIFLSYRKIFENFSEKFFGNYFGVGKYFREKFCAGSLNYFAEGAWGSRTIFAEGRIHWNRIASRVAIAERG
jgi:hypothetical protein